MSTLTRDAAETDPQYRRGRANAVAAVVGGLVVALVVVIAVIVLRQSRTTGVAGSGSTVTSPPASTSPTRSVAAAPGWTRVVTNNGGPVREGWASNAYLNGIQRTPPSPALAGAWQRIRGTWGWVLPVHQRPDAGSTVLGGAAVGSLRHLHAGCTGQNGIAFRLHPPRGTRGAGTPLKAARAIRSRYGIAYFGSATSRWQQRATAGSTATVTAGPTTLRLRRLGNDTWVIVAGRRCFS